VPNKGAIVRAVTAREVREICQVRRLLECQATRNACGRIDLSELHALAAELRRLQQRPRVSIAEFVRLSRQVDTRLHDLIAGSCGNEFLAKELGRLKILFRAFRDLSYIHHEARNDHRRLAEEAGEHLAIVVALQQGDALAASAAMATHIRSGVKYWTRAMPTRTNAG
jgi:DNA-binding GntR family transcriptional regulator